MQIVAATVVGHKAGTIRPMAAMNMLAAPKVRAPRRAIKRPPRSAPVIVASAIGRNSSRHQRAVSDELLEVPRKNTVTISAVAMRITNTPAALAAE